MSSWYLFYILQNASQCYSHLEEKFSVQVFTLAHSKVHRKADLLCAQNLMWVMSTNVCSNILQNKAFKSRIENTDSCISLMCFENILMSYLPNLAYKMIIQRNVCRINWWEVENCSRSYNIHSSIEKKIDLIRKLSDYAMESWIYLIIQHDF